MIQAHETANVGTDRSQLSSIAKLAHAEMGVDELAAVADRGYYEGGEIKACEDAGITVTLPKPLTSAAKAAGRFGKQDFVYVAAEDVYRCPAGKTLTYRFTGEDEWQADAPVLDHGVLEVPDENSVHNGARAPHFALGARGGAGGGAGRLDRNPEAMSLRRQTAEHPFGTIKCWMGATHFLCTTLPKLRLRWRSMCSPTI